MTLRCVLLSGAVAVAAGAAMPMAAAQTAGGGDMETVVVSGIRESVKNAIAMKMSTTEIVDSIVAEDIGKFPDQNVADSLQRVTGVQITRDLGEGNSIAIRGLSEVETTINGQEALTSGASRTLNLQDIPAELVKSVDVYKTTSANLLEGGLGGLVNISTFRPFDFDGLEFSSNFRVNYGSLRKKAAPQLSALVSDRWQTSLGEIGALLDVSFQRRYLTQYFENVGSPTEDDDVGDTAIIEPSGVDKYVSEAQRDRFAISGALQWRPVPELELYALGRFTRLVTYEDRYGTSVYPDGSPDADSVVTFGNTSDMASASYSDASVTSYGVARDVSDANQNYTLGANWVHSDLVVNASLNYMRSTYRLDYTDLGLTATVPTVSLDFTTKVPAVTYSGIDMADLSNYKVGYLTWSVNRYISEGLVSQLDTQWVHAIGPISEIDAGFRYASNTNNFSPIRYYESTGAPDATDYSYLFKLKDTNLFSTNAGNVAMTRAFYVADSDLLRSNIQGIRSIFDMDDEEITPSALSVYQMAERITSGYVMAKLDTELYFPVDGNFGIRLVNTNSAMSGNQTDLDTGGTKPINQHTSYFDALPSINLRVHFRDDLIWHVSAGKTVTRPKFSNLTPGLTLVPANATGTSGNPDLKPMYSTQVDTSLEYYFGETNSVYLAMFYKDVKNFVSTQAETTTIDDISYTISKPMNGESGTVKGYEVGYTQFYDFLPGLLSGLGLQANYTYVDSAAPSSVDGYTASLPKLSRHSFNLIGMYERGPLSARIAYNWRSKYYSSIYYGAGAVGLNPIYMKSFGWLSASVSYDIDENLALSIEGNNLLDTMQETYYSVPTRKGQYYVNDREFMVGLRYKL